MPGAKTRPRGIVNIAIVSDLDPEAFDYDLPDSAEPSLGLAKLANLLNDIAGGVHAARVVVSLGEVTPGTNTTQNGAELSRVVVTVLNHASVLSTDSIYIGPETLSWRTTPTASNHMDIKTNATTDAAEIASVINSYAGTKAIVSATSSGAQVTITSRIPGPLGTFAVGTTDVTAVSVGGTELGDGFGRMANLTSNTYAGIGTVRTYRRGI